MMRPATHEARPSPATILLVDDNPLNLELVADLLEAAGHTVVQAATAEAGIGAALTSAPDLILLDIGLPGMDGFEAVRVLKGDPRTCDIPTVALTAAAMAGDRQRAIDSGFAHYITKPIDTRAFPREIARLLAGRGGLA